MNTEKNSGTNDLSQAELDALKYLGTIYRNHQDQLQKGHGEQLFQDWPLFEKSRPIPQGIIKLQDEGLVLISNYDNDAQQIEITARGLARIEVTPSKTQ
jgi:hypothetical protein